MSSDATNVIELRNVRKHFGDFIAVQGADIEIGNGEFFSLLGPSGCGKTTTLRMIAGFESPSSGVILLDGEDVSKVPAHKRNINTVFQHYALFPHLSVAKNIAYGPRSKGIDRSTAERMVDEMLGVVRLEEFKERKPAQLSGGQQQRVALARALVNTPAALLLDEPLGALDLKLRHTMQFELKRIQREVGLSFVYVTHDQEEALTMSDRIAVMNNGIVEQIGTPTEIYNHPASVFVAGFIGQANLWNARSAGRDTLECLGTTFGVQGAVPGDCTLMVRPERMTASIAAPADGQSVEIVVTATTFQGPVVRVDGRAPDGQNVVAHLEPGGDCARCLPGDTIFVQWPDGAAHALPGHTTSSPIDDKGE